MRLTKLQSTYEDETMKKKELEIELQKLSSHPDPDVDLEQYMTPGDIAATLLRLAFTHSSVKDKIVCDLGCGTGRLAIGSALLGAEKVVGVDVDDFALEIAENNADDAGVDVEWVCSDVSSFERNGFDTVVQNPPFGVQNRGADMVFLNKALDLADEVYSIHKAGSKNRNFISGQVKEQGGKITNMIEKEFHIPAQFDFHTRDVYRFMVDIYRIVRR